MEAKTLIPFIDRYSGRRYDVDDVFETGDQERLTFLQNKGFLGKESREETKEKVNKKSKKNTGTPSKE